MPDVWAVAAYTTGPLSNGGKQALQRSEAHHTRDLVHHHRKHDQDERRVVHQQHFNGVQRLLDERRESAEGVFDENEHQQHHDRRPEVRPLEERQLSTLRCRRLVVLPRPHDADAQQRRNRRAGHRRQCLGDASPRSSGSASSRRVQRSAPKPTAPLPISTIGQQHPTTHDSVLRGGQRQFYMTASIGWPTFPSVEKLWRCASLASSASLPSAPSLPRRLRTGCASACGRCGRQTRESGRPSSRSCGSAVR